MLDFFCGCEAWVNVEVGYRHGLQKVRFWRFSGLVRVHGWLGWVIRLKSKVRSLEKVWFAEIYIVSKRHFFLWCMEECKLPVLFNYSFVTENMNGTSKENDEQHVDAMCIPQHHWPKSSKHDPASMVPWLVLYLMTLISSCFHVS